MSIYETIYISREEAIEALGDRKTIGQISPLQYHSEWRRDAVEDLIRDESYEIWFSPERDGFELHVSTTPRSVYRFGIEKPDGLIHHRATSQAISGCNCDACMSKVEGYLDSERMQDSL